MKNLKEPLAFIVYALLLVVGCGKDDEPTLSPVQFSIDQSTVDFGELKTSMQRSIKVTVTNTGEQTLILNSFTISGTNASEFLINEAEKTIEADKTHEFWVGFRPIEAGDKTAILTITSNIGEHKIDLSGKAILNPNDIVSIPDANFKASLLAHGDGILGDYVSKIDINDDGEIQVGEAQAYEGAIACYNKNITDLTGIEVFVNIEMLSVGKNQLTNLDLSQNIALKVLHCQENALTNLDVTQNIALKELSCNGNALTNLDISQNIALWKLHCSSNPLSVLDVSKNTALKIIYASSNKLTSLDVSQNIVLEQLQCSNNQLTALDLSNNTSVYTLKAQGNKLSSLDLSKNVALVQLVCYGNQLSSLNIANGNNPSTRDLHVNNNPDLTCIKIDSGFTPPSDGSWKKDDAANYNTSCL
ncbi:Internalin-J precursor [Mariniflexile rhizosphaerae]|uniref:choice-of-anchor D domain-containing protein n=1 Tax=unclassified Mariniflexile TaxID=2643887 RepID=UPI000CB5A6BE|nr:choice-of-anchor D domain-containing protein [Mariniflexile sp. TRM1-10]AXP82798.1 Internalin-J precursor [Mariniflexile sp. TRM1-10]PLB19054.1 MAG: Internalin-like protein [Flavobacteriaceae bacterium FS1-H7996/R]